ncbi:MAG: hypothetical protein ACRBBW_16290 [Cellvibrionaceae bacterium]
MTNESVKFAITFHEFMGERETRHIWGLEVHNAVTKLKQAIGSAYASADPVEIIIDGIAWIKAGEIQIIEDLPEPFFLNPGESTSGN